MKSFDQWFTELVFQKLPIHQGVECSIERANNILQELKHRTFPNYLRAAAEDWILQGDWKYKKPKELTVQDFYPAKEQLSKPEAFISLTHHLELMKKLQQSLEESNKITMEQIIEMRSKEMFASMLNNVEKNKELLSLGNENAELRKRLENLEFRLRHNLNREVKS